MSSNNSAAHLTLPVSNTAAVEGRSCKLNASLNTPLCSRNFSPVKIKIMCDMVVLITAAKLCTLAAVILRKVGNLHTDEFIISCDANLYDCSHPIPAVSHPFEPYGIPLPALVANLG
jgi:hypothetical protein